MTLIHNFHSSLTASHPCDDPNPCDQVNGICQTVDSQSQCSCKKGYELAADNSTCANINECGTDLAACTQLCSNTDGGYNCSCSDGYKLADNGFDCTGRCNICMLLSETPFVNWIIYRLIIATHHIRISCLNDMNHGHTSCTVGLMTENRNAEFRCHMMKLGACMTPRGLTTQVFVNGIISTFILCF